MADETDSGGLDLVALMSQILSRCAPHVTARRQCASGGIRIEPYPRHPLLNAPVMNDVPLLRSKVDFTDAVDVRHVCVSETQTG